MSEPKKPFPVRLDEEDLRMIDELRRIEDDIPTRSEMVRRLIHREARAAEKKRR